MNNLTLHAVKRKTSDNLKMMKYKRVDHLQVCSVTEIFKYEVSGI